MTVQVALSTSDDAMARMDEAHDELEQLEARLGALWSTHVAVDPTAADQIALAARYIRKAAAALTDPRLA